MARKNVTVDVVGDGDLRIYSSECGLCAVDSLEQPMLSDCDPKIGYFIMYRISNAEGDRTTYLWQRAKVLSIGDPIPGSSTMKEAVIRLNHSKKNATTIDASLGPENCGDGTKEGKVWFRVVNKADLASAAHAVFSRDEKKMMETNCLTKWDVLADGHCFRRALLIIIFGPGSDTPERLKQLLYLLAALLEQEAAALDEYVREHTKETGFSEYCYSRAEILRKVNTNLPCSVSEWGGGDYGCENLVISRFFGVRVVITTPGQPMATVYTGNGKFEQTDVRLSEFKYQPGDFVLSWVWGGVHFIPYLWRGSLYNNSIVFLPPFNTKLLFKSKGFIQEQGFVVVSRKKRKQNVQHVFVADEIAVIKESGSDIIAKHDAMRLLFEEPMSNEVGVNSSHGTDCSF